MCGDVRVKMAQLFPVASNNRRDATQVDDSNQLNSVGAAETTSRLISRFSDTHYRVATHVGAAIPISQRARNSSCSFFAFLHLTLIDSYTGD